MKSFALESGKLSVKEVDGLLYAWGEWRQRKANLNGYAAKTSTAQLLEGVTGFGRSAAKSCVPRGITFERDARSEVFVVIDNYLNQLSTRDKSIMLAYYAIMPRGVCTDAQRAQHLAIREQTMINRRTYLRQHAQEWIEARA